MRPSNGKTTSNPASHETRQDRRAFRKAMSNGLQHVFQPGPQRSVPNEFMDLLRKADGKTAQS